MQVGIDMSLTSPGAALQKPGETTIHVWGVAQRKREQAILDRVVSPQLQVSLTVLPETDDRWHKSHLILTALWDWIDRHNTSGHRVHCFIEGYALGMAGSSSVSKLCELGGILRYHLWQRGWTFSELAPTTVKKCFSGSGRADKSMMARAFIEKGYPSMEPLLGSTLAQHPQEDMIDALAVLYTGQQQLQGYGKV